LSAALAEAGHPPTKIHTAAKAHLGPVPGGFAISRIDLVTEGSVPGIDAETFGRRDL
jgi:osmotically inducible protein OsmC